MIYTTYRCGRAVFVSSLVCPNPVCQLFLASAVSFPSPSKQDSLLFMPGKPSSRDGPGRLKKGSAHGKDEQSRAAILRASLILDSFGFCCLSHPRLENLLSSWQSVFVIKQMRNIMPG